MSLTPTHPKSYIGGRSVEQYLETMSLHPRFRSVIDTAARLREVHEKHCAGNEFDSDITGRGDSYRRAQENVAVRATGIERLLGLALGGTDPARPPQDYRLLDALGGDGLIARYVAQQYGLTRPEHHWVLTADISPQMVSSALSQSLPAVCQPAQNSVLRDATFDSVLLAYGTHHIPPNEREATYREAARILNPEGRLVVHDFEHGGQVSRWFQEVVHRYAPRGHSYHHFDEVTLVRDLRAAGFAEVVVHRINDPFVLNAESPTAAEAALARYGYEMYGLFGLGPVDAVQRKVWELMAQYFDYTLDKGSDPVGVAVSQETDGTYSAVAPRRALVAVATK